ncbi:MAG: hypothetical protein KAH07_04660 [Flavobacteriaceae bacterium]|nr:hypothetical protein [Flavobacteriaceae bacterium]
MLRFLVIIPFLFSFLFSFSQENDSIKKVTTTFKFGGYAKADYLYSHYRNGDVSATNLLRDFHVPSQTPVGIEDENIDGDFHVKESRFNFDVSTDKFKKPTRAFIELDFLLSSQGNERISNSFSPRLRHFYFEYGNLLLGQTWSNFMIVVLPDDLDFLGAAEGLVFIRQPQVRLKVGSWAFSIENQETTITRFDAAGVISSEAGFIPDFTARKNFSGKWGSWSIAAVGRVLEFEQNDVSHTNFAYGITTGGKLKVGNNGDDFRTVLTYGSGLGRYVAVGFVASSVVTTDDLANVETFNGYFAFNHYWSKYFSSSVDISAITSNHDSTSNTGVNKTAFGSSVNLKYRPVKEVLFGIELSHANREILNGDSGSYSRLQLSAKYIFGHANKSVREK